MAIAADKIEAIAEDIPAASAIKVLDVRSLYLTPGLVDVHTHVMAGSGLRGSLPHYELGDVAHYSNFCGCRANLEHWPDGGGLPDLQC